MKPLPIPHNSIDAHPRRKKRGLLFFCKSGVSIGLIAYLVWLIDWQRVGTILIGSNKLFLLLVPLFLLIRLCFATWRWQLILADSQAKFPFWQAYTSYMVGAFYNVFLPGVTGGDVIRIGRCVRRTGCPLGTATASVLLERVSGVFALLSIALSTYIIVPGTLSSLLMPENKSSVTAIAAIGICMLAIITIGRRYWLKWLPLHKNTGFWGFIVSGMRAFCTLRNHTLVLILIFSIFFQAMDIVIIFLLSQMIRLSVPLSVYFAVVPLVYLAIMLPISLGGLGVREGSMTFLLAQFGVPTSDAVTLSFLVYVSRFVTAGSGGMIQLFETLAAHHNNHTKVENEISHSV